MATKQTPAQALHDLGQSVWLDTISDGLIQSGELQSLIRSGSVYGVTSNPTIFMKAIGGNQFSYPAEIVRLAGAGASPEEIYDHLSIRDIVRTADLLAETYHAGTGRDGFVSLEVPPALAHDTPATVTEAKRLWAKVDRPNLFVKVPATPEGIPAFEALIADGVSVNVTLIFGRAQYAEVAAAYRRGLERRLASGGTLDGLHSVASLFVSRLDTSVDKELESRGAAAAEYPRREQFLSLRGRAAVANALGIWEEYRSQFFGPEFQPLRAKGGRPQWLLWASTGTKNPSYSDVKYVEELAGPDTINTMPHETLAALLDHGRIEGDRLSPCVEPARETRRALEALGVSLEDHCAKLLIEGVRSFANSFDEMMAVIRERSAALAPRR
jgi:transaldolase/glucose-6-phosphate isomerase